MSHILGCNACLFYCSEAFGQYDVGAIFLLSNLTNYEVSPPLTKGNSDFLCQKETQIFLANLLCTSLQLIKFIQVVLFRSSAFFISPIIYCFIALQVFFLL